MDYLLLCGDGESVRGNSGMACRPNPSHGGTGGTENTGGRKESTNYTNEHELRYKIG